MTSTGSEFRNRLRQRYAELFADPVFEAFLGHSGYANYGSWSDGVTDGRAACDALVDRLLADVPDASGTILDVACGQGGTTERLTHTFAPERVTAINFCRDQLAAARRRAPGCAFVQMDAARLAFADGSFDNLLCIEAAFHFESRDDFLRGACRVLTPGGRMMLTDVLVRRGAGRVPAANRVSDLEEYASRVRAAGFEAVEVEDVSAATWRAFRRRFARFALRRVVPLAGWRGAPRLLWGWLWRGLVTERAIVGYVACRARKPAGSVGA